MTLDAAQIDAFLESIFRRFHHDFRAYARTSLGRRLGRALKELNCEDLEQLDGLLEREPSAFSRLLGMLTIPVSDLFRDPSYYLALRISIAPLLRTYPSLRIWVAGCSTGEEVYSMAIVLHEEGLLERSIIYATDINPEALHRAEAGVYSVERLPAFTENHRRSGGNCSLSEYYTAAYGSVVFDRRLVQRVVFADHSLATDNVFAEVQLVSCRNVMIYFDRSLQDRTLGLFKESLCRRGFLGLGSKETVRFSSHRDAFQEQPERVGWYQRC